MIVRVPTGTRAPVRVYAGTRRLCVRIALLIGPLAMRRSRILNSHPAIKAFVRNFKQNTFVNIVNYRYYASLLSARTHEPNHFNNRTQTE